MPDARSRAEVYAMHIELSEAEARMLKNALDLRHREMQNELVHTDDRAYRAGVRKDLECLEQLSRKLDDLLGSFASQPSASRPL
jgi:tRNA uridine 5-carbamoylmethylation protein Kti12